MKTAQFIASEGGRTTVSQLADLVRGSGGATFSIGGSGKGKYKSSEKININMSEVAGGKVDMAKEVCRRSTSEENN
jgi:ATP-dependent DNA helicase Q1